MESRERKGSKVEGSTRRDRIRTTVIRSNMQIYSVEHIIKENWLRIFGYRKRITDNSIARLAYNARVDGGRGQVRSRHTCEEGFREFFQQRVSKWS